MSSRSLDWIDELDNEDDDKTFFQQLMNAMYKSRQGRDYWWPILLAKVQDDELSDEESQNPASFTPTAANRMVSKRLEREK